MTVLNRWPVCKPVKFVISSQHIRTMQGIRSLLPGNTTPSEIIKFHYLRAKLVTTFISIDKACYIVQGKGEAEILARGDICSSSP